MNFRAGQPSDAAALAAISIEVWLGTYIRKGVNALFADYALNEFTKPKMTAVLQGLNEHVVVSENDNGIDGFIRLTQGKESPVSGCSTMEISTLYFQPRHHGRGLGKALLEQGFVYARSVGVRSVWLTTNSENTSAIAFYLKQGFEKVGTTHFTIQDQAYLNDVFSRAIPV
ncbi:GCN5 family acetyltransferase [Thioclava dalianensis]|uniref:GCN5 family acetyltransferase n=1 Tax=Thioclava dalianensis TaxID=1185766 RepID=A0A074TJ06_9RHOB|nr:GNAT family N-acetyltransferase [Thioclava dalianensis]KEP71686.1 GCN5 family acetyltransferase [Thioclava dalianensis]